MRFWAIQSPDGTLVLDANEDDDVPALWGREEFAKNHLHGDEKVVAVELTVVSE